MFDKFNDKLKTSYLIFRFEIYSYICLFAGMIKSKILFNKNKINKLEIGVGNAKRKNGFITSDINLRTDFPYDLRCGLPFSDNSIDFIYAEHVLEHFSYLELTNLLKDCYRVLKPGGVFSIAIPDARIYLNAYSHSKDFDFKKYCTYDFGLTYKSKIDYVNYVFYMGGHHRYMFDEDSILIILKNIGFNIARLRDFDSNLDQSERRYESIYIECSK